MKTYIIKNQKDLDRFVFIPGYENKYKINRLGEVLSVKRKKWQGNGWQEIGEKILKPVNQNGYLAVNLCINGKQSTKSIHRLVASVFIDNPDNKPQVNHKDGNKHNNNIENLEWVTNGENKSHSINELGENKPPKPKKLKETGEEKPEKMIVLSNGKKVSEVYEKIVQLKMITLSNGKKVSESTIIEALKGLVK